MEKEYGLIGRKLGHSFSAEFFNKKFHREGLNAHYSLFPLASISEFPELIKNHPRLMGLNVTIPYKEEIIPFLQEISEDAKEIGAVNVVKIEEREGEKYLKGFNTDCIGFKESLRPLLHKGIESALVLGTGGASKAVGYVLENFGIKPCFVSRKPSKGQLQYEDLTHDTIRENLLIVNTTPLGMYPQVDHSPLLPYHFISASHICYDLVYNPAVTLFMRKAAEQGATIKNGLEMLQLQALAAWKIWEKTR
ncbi:MAG: shikimate dehydrogenase [Muribaculaceae bacterium]|nr:shikimate dehydrogenase [Muribaculaceae bacterium]